MNMMLKHTLQYYFRMKLLCLIAFNLFLYGLCIGAASSENPTQMLNNQLCELAAEGKISPQLIETFYQFSFSKAKEQIPASEEFWLWVAQNEQIAQGLLVGLYPDYNPDVIKYLQILKTDFGPEVERYPHLALAFSFVYGAAKGDTIRSRLKHWTSVDRPVPSCSESFGYYLDNKDKMRYPLDFLPWPLMMYVADNDVPLSERQWALNHYKGKPIDELRNLHTEPAWRGDKSPTRLAQIREEGGICYSLAYYASRVLKSLGVPSYTIHVPDHAYEGWVAMDGSSLKVDIGAAFGYNNGIYFRPFYREFFGQFEYELLVEAMNHSYPKYLESRIYCHVFDLLPDESKADSAGLLKAAVLCNPYTSEPWHKLLAAVNARVIPLDVGWEFYTIAKKQLTQYPQMEHLLLCELTKCVMAQCDNVDEDQMSQIRGRLNSTIREIEKNKTYLGVSVHGLMVHADFLKRYNRLDLVLDQCPGWFSLKQVQMSDDAKLFNHIHAITSGPEYQELQQEFIDSEYKRRKFQLKKSDQASRAHYYGQFKLAADAYAASLMNKGDILGASQVWVEMDQFNQENLVHSLRDLRDVLTNATPFGVVTNPVTQINTAAPGCYVWQVLYPLPKQVTVRVLYKHPEVGQKGAVYLVAYADTDRDGVPDKQIGMSPLLAGNQKDEWSEWEFKPTDSSVYVGFATKMDTQVYLQLDGLPEGYSGLSTRQFYSDKFEEKPQKSIKPRFTNLQIYVTR